MLTGTSGEGPTSLPSPPLMSKWQPSPSLIVIGSRSRPSLSAEGGRLFHLGDCVLELREIYPINTLVEGLPVDTELALRVVYSSPI